MIVWRDSFKEENIQIPEAFLSQLSIHHIKGRSKYEPGYLELRRFDGSIYRSYEYSRNSAQLRKDFAHLCALQRAIETGSKSRRARAKKR